MRKQAIFIYFTIFFTIFLYCENFIHEASSFNKPLFYHAVKNGDSEILTILKLYNAIKKNDYAEIKSLVSTDIDLNKPLYNNQSLLLFLMRERQSGVDLLIENGADVNFIDGYGNSPLYQSIIYTQYMDNHDLTKKFIEKFLIVGADVNYGNDYMTPIMLATFLDLDFIVQLLFEYHADINKATDYFNSAIEVAELFNTKNVTKEFLISLNMTVGANYDK